MPGSKRDTILISAAIFIILEVAALGMLRRSTSLQNIWLTRFSHRIHASLWSGTENVRNYFKLRDVNTQLIEDNARLIEELQRYKSLEDETLALRKKDSMSLNRRFNYITGTVVKMSRNSSHNYIIIDKGLEDGVVEHSGIISSRGIVGIVEAVDKHYAYGVTLLNNAVSVSARVGGSNIVAPLAWDGKSSSRALLKDMPLHLEVAKGDTVFTSGFSSIYPPDIPIGITGDSSIDNGSSMVVEVKLLQDFSTLRHVIIAHNPEREKIINLETR